MAPKPEKISSRWFEVVCAGMLPIHKARVGLVWTDEGPSPVAPINGVIAPAGPR